MRLRPALLLLALASLATPGAGFAQASKFKLKPGAAGQACLDCHGDFQGVLKKASVHTPVRSKQCTGCHNPHASTHAKLLDADPNATCANCHAEVVPKAARSVHRPAAEGHCTGCHDPHASATKFNLTKPANELCASCHQKVAGPAAKAKFKHRPLEQGGCTSCHDPHGSAAGPDLLKKAVPALCVGCHKTDKPIFAKQHLGYNVSKSGCTSCHDPHGSSRRGILYDQVHSPVAKGMCSQCHPAPGLPNQFETKQVGLGLCRGCHNQKVNEILDQRRVHSPVIEGQGCLSCHSPHASKGKGLLRGDAVAVCGSCHADSVKRGALSLAKHAPVVDGSCSACHDPHSGSGPLMLTNQNVVEMCGRCHDWLQHSSHPMGEKVKDPRNRNLTVQCLSCHRGHGTEYKKLLLSATQTELCTKCHEQYKR
jgi:DmsE family decaheme c-type cytochrome